MCCQIKRMTPLSVKCEPLLLWCFAAFISVTYAYLNSVDELARFSMTTELWVGNIGVITEGMD